MRRFDLHQALAEKKSRRLIFAMVVMQLLTVIACAAFISLTFALLYFWMYPEMAFPNTAVTVFSAVISALAVTITIVSGGYLKMSELDGGGSKIAESMRGDLIDEDNSQLTAPHRQLLNIVQELAIASSIPAPAVYVLNSEPGINAMAAGHGFDDAVLIVTQGAVRHLSRDQMQGVIAHEFSHILNGDIARDMWLTAATHGNYFLLVTAQEMARYERYETISVESWFGYMLMPFGYFGACLARLFTACIKRENEFMADATAVELARYPQGLSDALMMIGGFEHRGRIKRREAIETGHMFLVDSGWSFGRWFGTHPSLDRRILRLRPDWDGLYLYENTDELEHYGGAYHQMTQLVGLNKNATPRHKVKNVVKDLAPLITAGVTTAASSAQPANADARRLDSLEIGNGEEPIPQWMAHDSYDSIEIDQTYRALVKDHQGAGLILAAVRLDQFKLSERENLIEDLDPLVSASIRKFAPTVSDLQEDQKLWLFDRAIEKIVDAPPLIRQLLSEFVKQTSLACEDETELARWAWQRIVQRKLNPVDAPSARFGNLQPLLAEVMILLSTVTHTDADGQALSQYSFMRAIAHTGLRRSLLVPKEQLSIADVEDAVEQLSLLSARQRRTLVVACTSSILANRSTNLEEAWVLRAICEGFNFPMPSVLPGQELAGI